jgi:hypothetical protein
MIQSENVQYIRTLLQKIDLSDKEKIILTVSFLLSGYAFLFLNPYKILNYVYLPFVLFFSIIGIYLFFSIQKDIEIMFFLYKLLYYILIFIVFCIIYFLLKNILLYVIDISFGAVFLFYLVGFAIIYKIFFENTEININKTDDLFYTIQYFIFYIPCILIIVINYIIDDSKNTNKTTYILGLLLILLIVIYFVIPFILNYMYKHDGILLIDKKTYLNKSILTLSLKELKDKIESAQTLWNYTFNKEGFKSLSDNEIKGVIDNISMSYNSTEQYVIKHMSKRDKFKQMIIKYKDKPDELKYYINNELKQSFLSKIYYSIIILKNKYFLSGEQKSEEDLLTQYISPLLYTYHYGISFWLYLDTNILAEKNRDKALILTLGSRPSLYYDYNTRQIIIEITDVTSENETFKQTRIYNSSKILFQKWNHIVMNYVNGQFDLFINNVIVSTQANVSPYINDSDVLQVGSVNNTDLGGISNLKYYDQPLSLYKIKEVYNQKLFSIE